MYQTYDISLEKTATRKTFDQFKEVFFYEDRVGIFGICDFTRGFENGFEEGQGNYRMAFPNKYL